MLKDRIAWLQYQYDLRETQIKWKNENNQTHEYEEAYAASVRAAVKMALPTQTINHRCAREHAVTADILAWPVTYTLVISPVLHKPNTFLISVFISYNKITNKFVKHSGPIYETS
jgi:hypothetical protein